METIRHIAVFDNDKYFLALLKGYCYANSITMTPFDFNRDQISKLEELKPILIVVPLDGLNSPKKRIETDCLRQIGARDLVKICGLIKSPDDIAIAESLKWLDVVITNPLDVAEIDAYLKKTFLLNGRLIEERRTGMERRRIENNGQIDESATERRAAGSQREAENSLFTGFRIDQRNKCVFLKDHKVDLTPKEFELVKLLSTDVDRIFKADEIISHLWPESDRATKSDLYQYMHLLRKKIEKDANNPQWIMNVKGFGYKLNSFLTE